MVSESDRARLKDGGSLPREVLWFFCGFALVVLLIWQASRYVDLQLASRERKLELADAVQIAHEVMSERLRENAADISILSNNPDLMRFANGDISARRAVEDAFADFARAKPLAAQIRFVDAGGRERVRVDRQNGTVKRVAKADLQDKSQRYYFAEAMRLSPGSLYLSRIDLNVENGEVEEPWRPTLRFATPIAGSDGKPSGLLIINLSANRLIGSVAGYRLSEGNSLSLLNAYGYWLSGVERNALWGFMFGHDRSLPEQSPDLWDDIHDNRRGERYVGGDWYTFESVLPSALLQGDRLFQSITTEDERWIILGRTAGIQASDFVRESDLPVLLVLILPIGVLSVVCAQVFHSRRVALQEKAIAQREIARVEKFASLGSLVAGVAHELNTPIGNAVTVSGAIAETVEQLSRALQQNEVRRGELEAYLADLREGAGMIERGLLRAAELIQSFKHVAVNQSSEMRQIFRLDELVDDVLGSLRPQFKKTQVRLEKLGVDAVEIDGYPGALSQIIVNLVLNALTHGFAEGQPGRVSISGRKDRNAVEISVSDNGMGMTADVRQRIFEPFFTTKLGKGGSGLGLSLVFNIVTGTLGGRIDAVSTPGKGTIMTIVIPRTAPAARA